MPVSNKLKNSRLTKHGIPENNVETFNGGPSVSFENKNGDVMVFTPAEARHALRLYIDEELNLYADNTVKDNKIRLEERINFRMKQFENGLTRHVDDKINKITETILTKTVNRIIDEEVNRRVEERLEKIKKGL